MSIPLKFRKMRWFQRSKAMSIIVKCCGSNWSSLAPLSIDVFFTRQFKLQVQNEDPIQYLCSACVILEISLVPRPKVIRARRGKVARDLSVAPSSTPTCANISSHLSLLILSILASLRLHRHSLHMRTKHATRWRASVGMNTWFIPP